jgi:acyl-CoA reductase-like NAD-dependent aldehyde dehydrogenase
VFSDGGMTEQIQHTPLGVVANISAWNYPWFVGCNVIVPALLTGNAVLYKPSEYATMTGLEIARLLHEAGVPRDVMACLVGTGEVGAALAGAAD